MTGADTSEDVRYAPPQAYVEDVATPGSATTPARRLDRFWAAMIDTGIAALAIWLVIWLSPWNPWGEDAAAGLWALRFVSTALTFAVFIAINGVLLGRRGQTVGKALLGLRIVRPDGSRASLGLLLVRYGVGYALSIVMPVGQVYFFVDTLMIFRDSRRCLHDLLADTIVVKA